MRVFGIVSFLAFFVATVPLFAQQGGTNGSSTGTSSISTEFGGSYEGVQNVSEQAAGTFVGGGRPTGFVGTMEIYNSSSSRSSSSTRQATTTRTATRSATTTAARRATTTTGRTAQAQSANNQTIRSITTLDFDAVMASPHIQPSLAISLDRVPGIQDGQVSFRSAPSGTTAVLTGTVASDRGRRVAQQLLLLEPGISRVDNLLELR